MNIGIDLGTTFSVAAMQDENGTLSIINNSEGNRLLPSVIMEDSTGTIVVGNRARERAVIMAKNVVSAAKDYMGTDHVFSMPSGKSFSPEEISSFILKKIRQDSEQILKTQIEGTVITVPAYFTDAQRKATEDAGRIAGFSNIKIINEPTAAAIYYAHTHKISNADVLVYDLGGGTFDASIVHISDEKVEVKATGGIRKLGGHFFDQMILNYVSDYLFDKYDIDLYEDEYSDELQEITQKAEECKKCLSMNDSEEIVIKIGSVKDVVTITKEQFESMINGFYMRTESTVRMILDDAGMKWSDIDKIILIGGSSRIPMISDRLYALSGIEPSQEINPDEAVAFGAAICANEPRKEIIDVNSHSIGIVTVDHITKKPKNTILLPRNTILPAKAESEFETADTASIINFEVTEGEDDDVEFVNIISNLDIELPPNTPKKTSVTVEMHLDKNQLLHVFVRVAVKPEKRYEIHIDRKSNMSEDVVALKTSLVRKMTIK